VPAPIKEIPKGFFGARTSAKLIWSPAINTWFSVKKSAGKFCRICGGKEEVSNLRIRSHAFNMVLDPRDPCSFFLGDYDERQILLVTWLPEENQPTTEVVHRWGRSVSRPLVSLALDASASLSDSDESLGGLFDTEFRIAVDGNGDVFFPRDDGVWRLDRDTRSAELVSDTVSGEVYDMCLTDSGDMHVRRPRRKLKVPNVGQPRQGRLTKGAK